MTSDPVAPHTVRLDLDLEALDDQALGAALSDGGQAALAAGAHRVEVVLPADRPTAVRSAARLGLRAEGTLRSAIRRGDGSVVDGVLVARVAGDPDPGSGEMFRAGLNAWLPRKRVIAQGLLRDAAGKVLLCELTYKRFWDLPGGVVDPLESPATAVLREVAEELSLKAHIVGLAAVGWMPPWRGWDDALLCVFELRLDEEVSAAVLQPREIAGIHWADAEAVREHCAEYTVGLIDQLTRAVDAGAGTIYLENSLPLRW